MNGLVAHAAIDVNVVTLMPLKSLLLNVSEKMAIKETAHKVVSKYTKQFLMKYTYSQANA